MNIRKIMALHPIFTHAAEISEICAPLKLLDISYFSYAHLDANKNLTGISNSPEFIKLYYEKKYYNHDLHLAKFPQGETYTIWDSVHRIKQTQAMHEDFTALNLGHTFSIIQNNPNGTHCYHFATKLGNAAMNGKYLQLLGNLKLFIDYFKEKVSEQNALMRASTIKTSIQINNGGFQEQNLALDFEQFVERVQSNRKYLTGVETYLTKRELECLHWLAQGKTFEETAIILSISARTVKAHITAVKQKTQCDSQFQLGMLYSKI